MPSRRHHLILVVALAFLGLAANPCFAVAVPGDGTVRFVYVVYFPEPPAGDLVEEVDRHPLVSGAALRRVEKLPDVPDGPVVQAIWIDDAPRHAPPPDREALQYLGRGLDAEQVEALGRARHALVLGFAHPRSLALAALAQADALVGSLIEDRNALPFDVEFRRVVSPQRWSSERVTAQGQARHNVMHHVAIHAYRDDPWIRAVTVGMGKFGLPDLVVDELASQTGTQISWIVNSIAQRMVEGQRPDENGWFALDLARIEHAEVRKDSLEDWKSNGSGLGRFRLVDTPPKQGDNDNALLAVRFEAYDGPDEFARQNAAVSAMFGWSDEIKRIQHDAELDAASQRARTKLPALREAIQRGLAPGEQIQVKLPFETPTGGAEWMWVEVSRWEGDTIEGVLGNEPFDIPGLHAGQRITGSAADVFDYIFLRSDGSMEGNETARIMLQMQGDTERRGAE